MNFERGELRPIHKTKGIDLIEDKLTTDAARTTGLPKNR